MTKLLILGILFSTAVNVEVVAKPLILGISVLTSFIFVLRIVLVAKLLISGILSSVFFILALYSVFVTTSVFTTLLSLIKSTRTGANWSISNLSTLLFSLIKLVGKFLIYWYLIYLLSKLEVSTCEIFLTSVFAA